MQTLIILGSSNSRGDTRKIVDAVRKKVDADLIDLNDLMIGYFDYEFKNSGDDFLPVMREIVENYDLIIFATPVYWYTMSGIMKVFFDRISDLLKTEKELGRKVRGKGMAVVSCGSDEILANGFHMPFVETAMYLGMTYKGSCHSWVKNGEIPKEVIGRLEVFGQRLYAKLLSE